MRLCRGPYPAQEAVEGVYHKDFSALTWDDAAGQLLKAQPL